MNPVLFKAIVKFCTTNQLFTWFDKTKTKKEKKDKVHNLAFYLAKVLIRLLTKTLADVTKILHELINI